MSDKPKSKPVIGIVGGIGAGKTAVAKEFAALGCALVDADCIGHRLLDEKDVRDQMYARWGGRVFGPDGRIDRKAVAELVFGDRAELEALDGLLHPRIRRQIERQIELAQNDPAAAAVVIDAAVMFEAGWDDLCTHLIFVRASQDLRERRVAALRGWAPHQWQEREKSQISLDRKEGMCNYTIDNDSSMSLLSEQVRKLLCQIVSTADRHWRHDSSL